MSPRRHQWGSDPRLSRLAELSRVAPALWPTRDRILYETSRLIAAKGYHGATTRDIADAVGIQQPSIFNHFANKVAITAELFEYDEVIPLERLRAIVREGGSPACQLYRYVEWQTLWYLEVPFDLRGLRPELITELQLDAAGSSFAEFGRTLNRLVREGVARRQFAEGGHDFLFPALNALANEVTRIVHHREPRGGHLRLADSAASFVLRATLADPGSLPAVREEAGRVGRHTSMLG